MGVAKGLYAIGAILGSIGVLLFVVLLSMSFRALGPNEMGLLYNVGSKHLDRTKFYTNGRHYVGVGNRFIKYQRTVQAIEVLDLESRTANGLIVGLQYSFNYRIQPNLDTLLFIYEKLGQNYETVLRKLSSNVVRDVAATFDEFSFYEGRARVDAAMSLALLNTLDNFGFDIDSFQFLNMNFPEAFSSSISAIQVAVQEVSTARYEQEAAIIQCNTSRQEAIRQADVIILDAQATASATYERRIATANAVAEGLREEAIGHKLVKERLGLSGEQFVDWMWISAISGTGMSQSTILTQPGVLDYANTTSRTDDEMPSSSEPESESESELLSSSFESASGGDTSSGEPGSEPSQSSSSGASLSSEQPSEPSESEPESSSPLDPEPSESSIVPSSSSSSEETDPSESSVVPPSSSSSEETDPSDPEPSESSVVPLSSSSSEETDPESSDPEPDPEPSDP